MRKLLERFAGATDGSLLPIFGISLIPLLLAVGMSVDYTSAVATKSDMQNALDAATLSIFSLKTDTTKPDREKALQANFSANGGRGIVKLEEFTVGADGSASAKSSATYEMPTNFMQLAMISDVPIGVRTAMKKNPSLAEATFNVDIVSGWWNKTITLYGKKYGQTSAAQLMQISYTHNRFGDPKGYGTIVLSKLVNGVMKAVQTKVCTTKKVNSFKDAKATDIKEPDPNNSSKGWLISCTMTTDPTAVGGAVIDVRDMETLYLEMKIPNPNAGLGGGRLPSGTKETLKSNDPVTSDRLFYDKANAKGEMVTVQVPKGTTVDIFSIVPCGETSKQAWEDGGSLTNKAVDADFSYNVSGKCEFSRWASQVSMTQ